MVFGTILVFEEWVVIFLWRTEAFTANNEGLGQPFVVLFELLMNSNAQEGSEELARQQ